MGPSTEGRGKCYMPAGGEGCGTPDVGPCRVWVAVF